MSPTRQIPARKAPARAARTPSRQIRKRRGALGRRIDRWQRNARRARRRFKSAPRLVRYGAFAAIAAVALVLLAGANLAYQVARKPTEIFWPVAGVLHKKPAETWAAYGPLFRAHATATITPELLAALAQVESTGNPVARTYWRWRASLNPLEIYAPASSAVGMFQMTDAAFAEARRYCVHRHVVVEQGCFANALYTRVLPSHAIELAVVYLDRHVAAVLRGRPAAAEQKQTLAALIHLCGPGAARRQMRSGITTATEMRCGDHSAASYLAKVEAMRREFAKIAAAEKS